MRQPKSHTINGFVYDIQQFGAKEGRIVLAHVMRVVAGAAEGDGSDAIAKLAAGLTDQEVNYLCDTFAKYTMVGPEGTDNRVPLKDQFDTHFIGRYGDMLKWLWAALETNYSSFFSDLGLSPDKLQSVMANAMLGGSPASPIAQSGASSSQASGA